MHKITLSEFLQGELAQKHLPEETFSHLLQDIAHSCKLIASAVNRGALTDSMGSLATENIQGETQKQLDVISNQIFLQSNQQAGYFAGVASEEMEEPYVIPEQYQKNGKYLLLFDPLDGSSNLNLNMSVGTIFSILPHPHIGRMPELQDFLQPGTAQICAGYALYGTSTMLVFTTGYGVNGFTLDEATDTFILTHPAMQVAVEANEFAINMTRQKLWEPPVQRYIEECLQGKNGSRAKAFNMRWVAAMVAEVHRILIRGGIFIYPIDSELRDKGGRLRLLYEANPMSFIIEQAGGCSSTGYQRIMQFAPNALHQRVPVIMGAKAEVERLQSYHL